MHFSILMLILVYNYVVYSCNKKKILPLSNIAILTASSSQLTKYLTLIHTNRSSAPS